MEVRYVKGFYVSVFLEEVIKIVVVIRENIQKWSGSMRELKFIIKWLSNKFCFNEDFNKDDFSGIRGRGRNRKQDQGEVEEVMRGKGL